jgi:hypothetical protein
MSLDALRTRPWLGVLLVGLLALVVRLPGLGRPLWLDEVWSMRMAALPTAEAVETLRHDDAHPPGYTLALKAWLSVFPGDLGARGFSLLVGLLHVAALGLVARRLLGPGAGLLAAALAAVSGEVAWPAVEVRSFALAALLLTLAWWAAIEALERGRAWRFALAALPLAAALWCFYHALLGAFALLGFALALKPPARRMWGLVLAGLGAGALFLPWLPALLEQHAWVSERARAGHAGLTFDARGLLDRWLNQHLVATAPFYGLGGLLALPVLGWAWWARRRQGGLRSWLQAPTRGEHARALRALVVLVLVYLLAALAVGVAGSFLSRRYVTFLAGAWCVLLAALLLHVQPHLRAWLVAALVVGGAAGTAWRLAHDKHPDWPAGVAALEARAAPGAPVLVEPGFETLCWRHYGGRAALAVPDELGGGTGARVLRRGWLEAADVPALGRTLDGAGETWLVRVRGRPRAEGKALDDALAGLGFTREAVVRERSLELERWVRADQPSTPK